jgi:hypothetical protein
MAVDDLVGQKLRSLQELLGIKDKPQHSWKPMCLLEIQKNILKAEENKSRYGKERHVIKRGVSSDDFVLEFVKKHCAGLPCEPQRFIDEFLSKEDERDISEGDFTPAGLRAHMENWISIGMPYYSGKPR